MALGTVKAAGGLQTQLVSDRSSDVSAQAISGLGDSVNRLAQAGMGYLNSRTDIETVYDQRAMKSKGLELDTQFLQYQQDRATEFTEFSRERSATPMGMTKDYDAMVGEREKAFLATVPPRHREEMTARLAQDRASRVGSAFTSELSLLDTADTNNLNTGLNTLGSGLKGGSVSLEDAEEEWGVLVTNSALPEETKNQFLERGRATLQGLEFGTIVEQAASGYGSVTPKRPGGVVAAGLAAGEEAVLNALAARESPDYNIWNGGTTFEGYQDHPAASSTAPGESTAAGKYQFILGTWRAATASYERKTGVKVPNFSPEWQDRVALHWAESVYNKWNKSGGTFREALASGDPNQLINIRRVLGNPKTSNPNSVEWEGWADRTFGPGGAAAADKAWLAVFSGESGYAAGGTGPADAPNPWTDPRFAQLSLDDKQGFANAASAAAESQKQAAASRIRLERDTFLDGAYNAGFINDPELIKQVQETPGYDAEVQAKINSGQEVFRATERSNASIGNLLALGVPFSSDKVGDLDRYFGNSNLAGIASGDPAAYEANKEIAKVARLLPGAEAFRTALSNPATEEQAIAYLGSVHAGDASILNRSGFSKDDIARVQLFKNIAERSGSQEKAYADYKKATDMSAITGKSPAQLDAEADKLFPKTFPSSDDVVDLFDGWFSRTPDTLLNENTRNQLMVDAATSYRLGYSIYGTEEGAEAYMQTSLDNLWGVTHTKSFNGGNWVGQISNEGTTRSVLMRHPPENYYTAQDGDFGFLYEAVGDFAIANGASGMDAVLMADDTTDQQVRNGKKPTYKVVARGEYGDAIILPDRFGGEHIDAGQIEMIEEEANRKNSVGAITAHETQVVRIQGELTDARARGADQETILALEIVEVIAKNQVQAAKLAATEQGYFREPVPLGPDDPMTEQGALRLRDFLNNDPIMPRRVAALMKKYTEFPENEARSMALAEVVEKELKLTPASAIAVVQRMLELEE